MSSKQTKLQELKRRRVGIVFGQHGNEITPLIIAAELKRLVKSESIKDRVVFIGPVNPDGIKKNTRYDPVTKKDPNRMFPGKSHGDPFEKRINKIFRQLLRCQLVVDLHAFVGKPTLATVYHFKRDNRAADQLMQSILNAMAFPMNKTMEDVADGVLAKELTRRSILALTIEVSPLEHTSCAEISRISKKLLKGIRFFLTGKPECILPAACFVSVDKGVSGNNVMFTPQAGIRVGAKVSRGQILGTLTNVINHRSVPVICKAKGVLQSVAGHRHFAVSAELYVVCRKANTT